jgi:Tfp pilus assembly protein PilF
MKKTIFPLVLLFLGSLAFGQNKDAAEELAKEGVAYHDKGDYEGAIAKYDKALQLDKDNLLALAEKAMTLTYMHKYDGAIVCCQQAIEAHPDDKGLASVFVTYGNALDGLHMADKALEVYDEGLKRYPGHYHLYFNKGITLAGVKKIDEALACLQTAVKLNPDHAGSHNAIARLQMVEDKRIPSLLAYSRFFVLEPEGQRAKENLGNVRAMLKGNVEQTGKNSITIKVDSDMLPDSTANGQPKENDFALTDLTLALSAGLDYDKKNKKKTEVERFIRKFELVCATLGETKKDNHGFYWDYYAPYFREMKDKGLVETFGYIAFASSDDPKVSKWLKAHGSDIDKFYEWSSNFDWKTD